MISYLALLFFYSNLVLPSYAGPSLLPGAIVNKGGNYLFILEEGRQAEWSPSGTVTVKDVKGKTIVTVNLKEKAKKVSGSQALGLGVEETDLGGSLPTNKIYLQNKRVVKGRALSEKIAGAPLNVENSDVKTVETGSAQGINFKKTLYNNGAFAYRMEWPGEIEEAYFDLRGNLRWNRKQTHVGPITYTRTQWADGSYTRQFSDNNGSMTYASDTIEGYARFGFNNANQDSLVEITCSPACEKAEYRPEEEKSDPEVIEQNL